MSRRVRSVHKDGIRVTRTIRVGAMSISDEEFLAGMPSRETMEAAIAGKVCREIPEEKLEKLAAVARK